MVWVRNDIAYTDEPVSGTLRKGEYVISTVQVKDKLMWYPMRYLENYLNPVYILAVDGVPLLKIWKNDIEHTKTEYNQSEERIEDAHFRIDRNSFTITLPKRSFVTRVELDIPNDSCKTLEKNVGKFTIQARNDKANPLVLPVIDFKLFSEFPYPKPFYLLAAEEANSIQFDLYKPDLCFTMIQNVRVYRLKNNPT